MTSFEEPSRWTPIRVQRQIDPVLLADKRLEISLEMQPKSLAAKNSAKNDHQWANAELIVVNEWAEKLFAAWIEIWDIQGYPRCHALYRAIFEGELLNLFAVRIACFNGERNRRALIHRTQANNNAIGGWFKREMDRLSAKWNRRMSVESRKNMYAAKREESEAQAIRATAPSLPLVPLVILGNKPKVTGKAKALTAIEKTKRKVIFGAIQANAKGTKYCKILDERKLAIPAEWIQDGCPKTYADAYRAGQPWQKRIQDEKSRYKKKFDQTPAAELEKLLQ